MDSDLGDLVDPEPKCCSLPCSLTTACTKYALMQLPAFKVIYVEVALSEPE